MTLYICRVSSLFLTVTLQIVNYVNLEVTKYNLNLQG